MKRLILLALVICLMLPFCAASAREGFSVHDVREQAADGWHQSYHAHGRDIVVDVEASVPDVAAIPISKCKYAEHALNLAENAGFAADASANTSQPLAEDASIEYNITDILGISSLMLANDVPVLHVADQLDAPIAITDYYPPIELDRAYFSGYSLTLREVIGRFREMLGIIGIDPDETVAVAPYVFTVNDYADSKKGEPIPSIGWADFHQLLHGVPILAGLGEAYVDQPMHGATARLGFILSHEHFFVGAQMMTETEQLAADVPLCGFADVIAALEGEIEAGRIRKVFDLALGYALCSAPENGAPGADIDPDNRFYAVPVWVANCLYVPEARRELRHYDDSYGADERNKLEYQTIMVNAQTGALIDPLNQGKDRGYYEGFISWEGVGK